MNFRLEAKSQMCNKDNNIKWKYEFTNLNIDQINYKWYKQIIRDGCMLLIEYIICMLLQEQLPWSWTFCHLYI